MPTILGSLEHDRRNLLRTSSARVPTHEKIEFAAQCLSILTEHWRPDCCHARSEPPLVSDRCLLHVTLVDVLLTASEEDRRRRS